MRTILFAKRMDLILQLVCLLIPLLFCNRMDRANYIVMPYFLVGGCQLLSALINGLSLDREFKISGRKYYLRTLLAIIIVFCCASVFREGILFCLLGLLFVSPVLAIWYFIITWIEMGIVKRFVHRRDFV